MTKSELRNVITGTRHFVIWNCIRSWQLIFRPRNFTLAFIFNVVLKDVLCSLCCLSTCTNGTPINLKCCTYVDSASKSYQYNLLRPTHTEKERERESLCVYASNYLRDFIMFILFSNITSRWSTERYIWCNLFYIFNA
jgi:hypothetical protein